MKLFNKYTTLSSENELPVGLFGEHKKMILVLASTASKMASTLGWNSLVNNTSLLVTSFKLAKTLYIPYVGGNVIMLSIFGSQNPLNNKSNTSSLPFPSRICFFCKPLFCPKIDFTDCCCGSG